MTESPSSSDSARILASSRWISNLWSVMSTVKCLPTLCWLSTGPARNSILAPPSRSGFRSVLDPEVVDESDLVAVWVGDGGQLHTFVDRINLSGKQALSGEIFDVAIQIIDGEVHQS